MSVIWRCHHTNFRAIKRRLHDHSFRHVFTSNILAIEILPAIKLMIAIRAFLQILRRFVINLLLTMRAIWVAIYWFRVIAPSLANGIEGDETKVDSCFSVEVGLS